MSTSAAVGSDIEVRIGSGRIAGKRWGSPDAPLVLCVPGLSQDERSYAFLGGMLGSDERQVVAIAPRGRGLSDRTPPGTHGWPAHARDALDVASALGADRFDMIGWSFGAFVTMQAATIDAARIRRAVFLDVLGKPEEASLGPILAGIERLGAVYPSREDYEQRVFASGAMAQCADVWEPYISDDLVPTEGGYTTRTSRDAVMEDTIYGGTHDCRDLWWALTMPVLVVRAARPILPGLGYVVSGEDVERFGREVPSGRVIDVDVNHYCVGMVPRSAELIDSFLREEARS
jgi:pimeloyl-ACP methyl ester carboxylesterase